MYKKGSFDTAITDRRVTVATDASLYDAGTGVALAYVSSHGHYGLSVHTYPKVISPAGRSTVCELRAIQQALDRVFNEETRAPVQVLTDSKDALRFLEDWKQGGDRMPAGYNAAYRLSGAKPSLVVLSHKVHKHPMISFRLVVGHSGHPLNETADSMAKLGLRFGRGQIDRKDVRRLVPMWAERGHADYVKSLATSERGSG